MRFAIGVFLLAAASVGLAEPHRAVTVTLAPGSLVITAPAGGPDPATPTLSTLSVTGGKVDWNAAPRAQDTWLKVSPTSGSLNPNGHVDLKVEVRVMSPVMLAPGQYIGHITVNVFLNGTTTHAPGSPFDLQVTLNVSSSAVVTLSPDTALNFAAPTGVQPANQSITLTNAGASPLTWTATTNKPWLHVSPTAGSNLASGVPFTITVSVDVQAAPLNDSGIITVKETSNAANNDTVNVNYVVSSLPRIQLLPASLTFDAAAGGPNPGPQFLALTNTGGQNLNWSVSIVKLDAANWLFVDPPLTGALSAGSPTSLTVRIDNKPGGVFLPAGVYRGTITVSGTTDLGAPVTSQTSDITLNVNADPTISLNPDNASFKVSVDSPASPTIGVVVQNTGSGQLGWSVTDAPSWAHVTPGGGSLAIFGSQSLLLSVNAVGMAPGLYTGSVTISGVNESVPAPFPAASNSPQLISVTMTVVASSLPTSAPAGQCGLSGLEGLLPVLAFLIRRRLAKRGELA